MSHVHEVVPVLPADDSDNRSFNEVKVVEKEHVEEILHARVPIKMDYTPPQEAHHADDTIQAELSWRSWAAVSACTFAVIAQVYIVVGPASVIAFIGRDLGFNNVGWIIQAPLLFQCVMSPILGRVSDLTNRKWLAVGCSLFAAVGCIISATAKSMNQLIGGGILIGFSLISISITVAIPAETLPMKYRALANGLQYLGGNIGGWSSALIAGAMIKTLTWRWIYWIQLILHAVTAAGIIIGYKPLPREYPKLSARELLWAVDALGASLFAIGGTLTLLGLNWAGAAFAWKSAHVIAPLCTGVIFLISFGMYEWKGRTDGMIAHVLFKNNRNFFLAMFAYMVEGYLFFGAYNTTVNLMILNFGWETDAFKISVRQLPLALAGLVASFFLTLYATKMKDVKSPLIFCYCCFLAGSIGFALAKPTPAWDIGQQILNVVCGIGQAGPLVLIVTIVQFCAPNAYLACASGLAFSARAIGGGFGSAIVLAITNGLLASRPEKVAAAAISNGLPASSVVDLLTAMALGLPFDTIPGITPQNLEAALVVSRNEYAHAYGRGWIATIPFIVISIIAIALIKDIKHLMTEHVEAPVEDVHKSYGRSDFPTGH